MRSAARSTFLVLGLAALPLVGCSTSDLFGNAAGLAAGGGRAGEVARAAVSGAADTATQMNRALSPEQEYYLGRAVAAQAIARYGLDPDERRQDYVRKVGAAIVAISERLNATYGGYHFGVLNTDVENGLSGPGGFVLITRGAMLRCRSEDELAGILCHELAHVTLKHGEAVMRAGGPWQRNMGAIFQVVAAAAGADDASIRPDMVKFFGEAAGDLFKTLAENGYGKAYEFQADLEGTILLYDVGYDGSAIQTYLAAAEGREAKSWDTHPAANERIAALDEAVKTYGHGFDGGVGRAARDARWKAFLEGKLIEVPQTKADLPASETPAPPEPPADADTGSGGGAPPAPAEPEPPAGGGADPLR
jgi:predicted Zn-dependent protease